MLHSYDLLIIYAFFVLKQHVPGVKAVISVPPAQTCPSNQKWTNCGTACPETCQGRPQHCTFQCVVGCECIPGFVRHNATCIHKSECPKQNQTCSENEEFTACGTACPGTCNGKPEFCTLQCVAGCQCKPGFVLNETKNCIRKDQCPQKCQDPNEEPASCGILCDCEEYKQNDGHCPETCAADRSSGELPCFCKKGYIKDNATAQCIPFSQCCETIIPPLIDCPPRRLNQIPVPPPGCDYELDYDERCCQIGEQLSCSNSSSTCEDPNAERRGCWMSCSCEEYRLNEGNCPEICVKIAPFSLMPCECKDGFVRQTIAGECVPVADCQSNSTVTCPPPPPLPASPRGCHYDTKYDASGCQISWNLICDLHCYAENETKRELCGCEEKCVENGNSATLCPYTCRTGCFCKPGYVRNADNACVLERDCQTKEKICRLPAAVGFCKAAIPRFYYNRVTQRCEQFTYGGCGGNGNNFETKDECIAFCSGVGECPTHESVVRCFVDPCLLASCPSIANTNCIADYCGGCHARFYDLNGQDVTMQCLTNSTTTVAPRPCTLFCTVRGTVCEETLFGPRCVPINDGNATAERDTINYSV